MLKVVDFYYFSPTEARKRREALWLLPDAPDDVVQFLANASFEITRAKKKAK